MIPIILTDFEFWKSYRTYRASTKWRQNNGAWVKDPCYCMTTNIEHPEDVLTDDEPVFEEDQSEWIGERVNRTDFPETNASSYFGQFLSLMLITESALLWSVFIVW